jgi:L-arabinokinase
VSAETVDHDFARFEEAWRAQAADFFAVDAPIVAARAPGRLDVMGGIADYSGSLVAELPIAAAAVAAVQADPTVGGAVRVRSLNAQAEGLIPEVTIPAEIFTNPVSLLRFVRESPAGLGWVGYVAGCVSILRAEGLIARGVGARILVRSEVPLGAGVSSSAAIEVATMRALTAAFGIPLDGLALARACQRVENEIVDAPCGIMDQVTSTLGESGRLLLLLCQPHTVQGTTTIPDGWRVVGIDSRVKHSVAGTGYTDVRVAAFMGYRILAARSGSGFGGYLCNVTPEDYARIVETQPLPEAVRGADFLAEYGGIYDTVTAVRPEATYPVRAATEHPIFENRRVRAFLEALSSDAFADAGQQMLAAHASYSACGLGTLETDLLVSLAMAQPGVVGAKITGGGSGGTVCVLCRTEAEHPAVDAIAGGYTRQTGIVPRIIRGTSSGAMATAPRFLAR